VPARNLLAAGVSLRSYNTFGLEARAEYFARPASVAELNAVLEQLHAEGRSLTVLGGGTNVVLKPWLRGCVLQLAMKGVEVRDAGDSHVLVTAAAGEDWHALVRFCIGQGLAGVENLALIPGSVGAAPIQNIGAYGMELSQRLVQLTAVPSEGGDARTFSAAECGFGYRSSVFKQALRGRYLVTSITLRLSRSWHPVTGYPDVQQELERMATGPGLAQLAEAVIRIRRRKLPDARRHGNAGSFFKNPVVSLETYRRLCGRLPGLRGFAERGGMKIAAAHLIDAGGWKGRRHGGALVWYRQPLVVVNAGNAKADDVLGLARAIADDVMDRFGVALEREVQVLGETPQ
jgi:UDP-N-acetylmuramate dehydrogenase